MPNIKISFTQVRAFFKRHKKIILLFLSIVIGGLLLWALYLRLALGWGWASWTGFNSYIDSDGKYHGAKRLWDWLELLIIPIMLTIGGLWFSQQQGIAETKLADRRYKEDRQLADQKVNEDREIASDYMQEEVLKEFFDRMTELILDRGLKSSDTTALVRDVARSRTLTAFRRLNGIRKGILVKFLHETELIMAEDSTCNLEGAELSNLSLGSVRLSGINLQGARLWGADLHYTRLDNSNLQNSDFREASLYGAYFGYSNLKGAIFGGADLTSSFFANADLRNCYMGESGLIDPEQPDKHQPFVILRNAFMYKAKMENVFLAGSDLTGACLIESDLHNADLREAILFGAQLRNANLTDSDLTDADLSFANLSGAQVDCNQLKSAILFRTVMPDGTIYDGKSWPVSTLDKKTK